MLVEAMEAASVADYGTALGKFKASFSAEENPITLWAWAQAARAADGCRAAVPLFKRFLEFVEPGTDAYEVAQQAVVECVEELSAEDDVVTVEPDDKDVEPGPEETSGDRAIKGWRTDAVGWSLVGVGIAGVGAGGGMLIYAGTRPEPGSYGDFASQAYRLRRLQITGGIVLGVGGALLVGGIVRLAVVRGREAGPSVAVAPTGRGLLIWGRF